MDGAAKLQEHVQRLPGDVVGQCFPIEPKIITEDDLDEEIYIYDSRKIKADGTLNPAPDKVPEKIIVQNLGAQPVYFGIDIDDIKAQEKFSGILAAGVVANDGTGGSYIFYPRRDGISRIMAVCQLGQLRIVSQHYIARENKY